MLIPARAVVARFCTVETGLLRPFQVHSDRKGVWQHALMVLQMRPLLRDLGVNPKNPSVLSYAPTVLWSKADIVDGALLHDPAV